MHKAVFDHRGLGVHAHDLVALRLAAGDCVETVDHHLLDQLAPRDLVLDTHIARRGVDKHAARAVFGGDLRKFGAQSFVGGPAEAL
jgi:hypothetical protein